MSSSDSSFTACGRADALRDYAFDELPPDERRAMEQHLAACGDCALELDQLRVTTAALRTLPDREIPQRIAFVSDRVFQPSWFARFWSSGAQLGFASACVLAVAMVASAWHFTAAPRPAEIRASTQTVGVSTHEIDAAVAKAVAQVRAKIASEDAKLIQAAVETSAQKERAVNRNELVALEESYMVLQKRLGTTYARLASNDVTVAGAGQ
jgi:anti-sigma factor RsiW